MQLGDLKTQFKGLLNNSVVGNNASLVTTFINQSIQRLQRELRVPFMEKIIDYTIPSDGSFTKLAIPNDMLELIGLFVDQDLDGTIDYELRRTDFTRVAKKSELNGLPAQVYTRQGGSWIIGPMPVPGSLIRIQYYAEFAPVVLDTDENTCLKVAWDAVLYGALSAAADWLVDERASTYEGRYTQITQALQNQADADELTADAVLAPALNLDNDGYEGCSW